MNIITSDYTRTIDVGSTDFYKALYSTAIGRIGSLKRSTPLALEFLKTGKCKATQGYETARQLNLIRDKLSQVAPGKMIYDIDNPQAKAPWGDNISPVITSCGNMFTTADGKDLIYELVSILCFAQITEVDVQTSDE